MGDVDGTDGSKKFGLADVGGSAKTEENWLAVSFHLTMRCALIQSKQGFGLKLRLR